MLLEPQQQRRFGTWRGGSRAPKSCLMRAIGIGRRAYRTNILRKMGKLGLMGVCVPEEWGGAGADFVSYAAAMEEIAYGDAGVANIMAATNSPVSAALVAYGNEEQKRAS